MGKQQPKVVVIGAGNLAWHLVPNLQRIGLQVEIWSRQASADTYSWSAPLKIIPEQELPLDRLPDAVFLAVPDDQINPISQSLTELLPAQVPIIHTSGATPITAITGYFTARAVLWPIISMKLGETIIEWATIPLVYAGEGGHIKTTIQSWANAMSSATYALGDEERAQLHLAAVFGNNFTNWLSQIAYELCSEKQIPFTSLIPLIQQTFSKLNHLPPALSQTGAASRGDQLTMSRHQEMLAKHPEYVQLYTHLSQLIQRK